MFEILNNNAYGAYVYDGKNLKLCVIYMIQVIVNTFKLSQLFL